VKVLEADLSSAFFDDAQMVVWLQRKTGESRVTAEKEVGTGG
jgi:hypothetical protein